MTDAVGNSGLADRLLQQDFAVQSPQYQEHRMELERQLKRAERNVKVTGYVVVAALVIALLGMFASGTRLFGSPDPTDRDANALSVFVAVVWNVATITFWLGLASYISRFQPAVRQAKDNLLFDSVRRLQQDLDELRRTIKPPTESGSR